MMKISMALADVKATQQPQLSELPAIQAKVGMRMY